MLTNIFYRDITKTDHLETYLLDKIEGLVEKFMHDDPNSYLTVRVETERHRMQSRKPVFTCEVLLKPTHSKKVIKIKKTNEDFYACVSDVTDAIKKTLSRRASRRLSRNRHGESLDWSLWNEEVAS